MNRSLALLGFLALAGCCFDGLSPTISPSVVPVAPPVGLGSGTGPLLPGPGTGLGMPIEFGAGTLPDPIIVVGTAGGPVSESTFDASCYGYVQMTPSHVLTVTSTVAVGRIMAFPTRGADLTLMVRLPSGRYLCNDDSDGLNPQIETTLMPGEYQIFVGTFSSTGPGEPYELGVSANPAITASTLHTPPPFVPTASGSVLVSGTGTVTSVSGSIPGVYSGAACNYSQTRVTAVSGSTATPLDCVWRVTCGGTDVYGGRSGGGYQPCADPTWSAGTVALDTSTTSADGDPSFVFVGSHITLGDDAGGTYGTFALGLDTTATTPATTLLPETPGS